MILIAGAGIAGLTLGLSLYQIGIPFRIFERVEQIKPLGVGINLQPHAVRELFDLGLEPMLDRIGLRTAEYGFYSKTGREIWVEPRGEAAGYRWPQFSIHRGKLQVELHAELIRRAGPDCVQLGAAATGFTEVGLLSGPNQQGALVVACDGIHSALRAQMYPDEGPPIWNGAVLWRGTTWAKPFLSGASMVIAGHETQRIVAYPISRPDPETGLALINWIAERKFDPSDGWRAATWTQAAKPEDYAPHFADWRFEWLDVPALLAGAETVYEYPMVDRDPLPSWTRGRVTLMGDAAHPTYPVGSNGASQAIVDARVFAAMLRRHGATVAALQTYEAELRPRTEAIILANRGAGPDAILQVVEDRCGGAFDRIEDVISRQELADHAERYKQVAGMSVAQVNAAPGLLS